MNFLISCGGTGGHMYPGLAVAGELARRGHRVRIVLSGRGVEEDGAVSIPAGCETLRIPSVPVSPRRPASLWICLRGILRARDAMRAERPDAVLAMGSYTSIAPVVAARWCRVPVVLHEANAVPGKAIAALARRCRPAAVCTAFPEAAAHFLRGARIVDVGMPLRANFVGGTAGSAAAAAPMFSLLVMGGSQGARNLNRLVAEGLAALRESDPARFARLRVVNLAGSRNEDEVRALYEEKGLREPAFRVLGFSNEMPRHYAEANACVSRAGASSCMELALVGMPALFVPLPNLAGDHQTANARSMAARGAGRWVAQSELTPARFAEELRALMDEATHGALRAGAIAAARPDAAKSMADVMESIGR